MKVKVKKKYPLYILGCMIMLMGIVEFYTAFFPPAFYVNITNSEPQGIYKVVQWNSPWDLKKGDYVILDVPEDMQPVIYGRGWIAQGTPLLKQIGAMYGDEYTVTDTEFYINQISIGAIAKIDRGGDPLPQLPQGTKKVTEGHLLVISQHHVQSFDSRYMGEIEMSKVRTKVVPMLTFN